MGAADRGPPACLPNRSGLGRFSLDRRGPIRGLRQAKTARTRGERQPCSHPRRVSQSRRRGERHAGGPTAVPLGRLRHQRRPGSGPRTLRRAPAGPPTRAAASGVPPEAPLSSLSVFPADRTGELPPKARGRVPPEARTVVFIIHRGEAPPPRSAIRTTPCRRSLSPASLLEETLAGRLVWARSGRGPVLKAGGRAAEGLDGREIWITLSRQGREYLLALTSEMRPTATPSAEERVVPPLRTGPAVGRGRAPLSRPGRDRGRPGHAGYNRRGRPRFTRATLTTSNCPMARRRRPKRPLNPNRRPS